MKAHGILNVCNAIYMVPKRSQILRKIIGYLRNLSQYKIKKLFH